MAVYRRCSNRECGSEKWGRPRYRRGGRCPECGGHESTFGYRVYTGRVDANGKRERRRASGFDGWDDASTAELQAKVERRVSGGVMPARPEPRTVADAAHAYFSHAQGHLQPRTLRNDRATVDKWIVPRLGHMELALVEVEDLVRWRNDLMELGLAPKSVKTYLGVVKRIFAYAVDARWIPYSPADAVRAPRLDRTERVTWTAAEARRFLDRSAGHPDHVLWLLALTTGMRRAEIVGLTWEHVDLPGCAVRVVSAAGEDEAGRQVMKEPKTTSGRRRVPLHPTVRDALARLPGREGHVFVDRRDNWLKLDTVSNRFERQAAEFGLPAIGFHGMRHTYATLALETGVPVKVVSTILGHSGTAVTENTYQHVTADLASTTVNAVAAHLLG